MRVCGWGGVGFHTMFLLDLVSVFFHLAALCTFVCVVRPLRALLRIFNILVCHTIISSWSVAAPYLLRFFFCIMYLAVLGTYGDGIGMGNGDIWVWFVFVRMLYDVRGGASFVFACGVVLLAPSFTNLLGFLIYARVAGEM